MENAKDIYQRARAQVTRRNYKSKTNSHPISLLPFVDFPSRRSKIPVNYWSVPSSDNYEDACKMGGEYAAHFIKYLQDNPENVGSNILGEIASHINFKDELGTNGYWVGFFSYLEKFIDAGSRNIDVYEDIERRQFNHTAWMKRLANQKRCKSSLKDVIEEATLVYCKSGMFITTASKRTDESITKCRGCEKEEDICKCWVVKLNNDSMYHRKDHRSLFKNDLLTFSPLIKPKPGDLVIAVALLCFRLEFASRHVHF